MMQGMRRVASTGTSLRPVTVVFGYQQWQARRSVAGLQSGGLRWRPRAAAVCARPTDDRAVVYAVVGQIGDAILRL